MKIYIITEVTFDYYCFISILNVTTNKEKAETLAKEYTDNYFSSGRGIPWIWHGDITQDSLHDCGKSHICIQEYEDA